MLFDSRGFLLTIFLWLFLVFHVSSFRASTISIEPDILIADPNSVHTFTCTNNEGTYSTLEISLTRNISSDEVSTTFQMINETSIEIRLEIKNYVGTFHLLCYNKGARTFGIRSDVLVKGIPGVIQLKEKCRVHEYRYLKCTFLAPSFAKASKNDYPITFAFEEINIPGMPRVYSNFKFMKNESDEENLVFKWTPMTEGEFPNSYRMIMNATMKYRTPSTFIFDTSPVFVVERQFNVTTRGHKSIQINLQPSSSVLYCQKSIIESSKIDKNHSWSDILQNRDEIKISDLRSNTYYHVCLRCRYAAEDPPGTEFCKEVQTRSSYEQFLDMKFQFYVLIAFVAISISICIFFIYRRRLRQNKEYDAVNQAPIEKNHDQGRSETSSGSMKGKSGQSSFSSLTLAQDSIEDISQTDEGPNDYRKLSGSGTSFLELCQITKI